MTHSQERPLEKNSPIVRFRDVTKNFPGVVALSDVTFNIEAGTCHALIGENGAGKSTLGKVLAGVHRPDGGEVELDGVVRSFHSPLDAQRAGVSIIHQAPAYCPNLPVAENLCLVNPPRRGVFLDRKAMRKKAADLLDDVGAECDLDEELGRLPTAQIQMVQIAGALGTGARVIVMDEPTSSLSIAEAERLYDIIHDLVDRGTTILYVSHRMNEIFRVCDTVTVLRDGRHVATMPLSDTDEEDIVRKMIGRPLSKYFPAHTEAEAGPEVLRVKGLSSPGKFECIDFRLRAGEVLGLAGLVGAGRSEVALSLFGLDAEAVGDVFVNGEHVQITTPKQAMSLGIGLVPEDRKRQGLILGMSCGENVSLPCLDVLSRAGFINKREERRVVDEYFRRLSVQARGQEDPAESLSGGNQQKLVLAKWLARRCSILIFDEPTRGVDVGAKSEIHNLMDELASSGCAVLLISSELPEILNLSSRIVVLRRGEIVGELSREDATQEAVMQLMAGINPGGGS